MKTLFLLQLLFVCSLGQKYNIPDEEKEKTPKFWHTMGKKDLKEALSNVVNDRIAKNIIIFVGDGLGITASTAGRIYKGQLKNKSGEESKLAWDDFPNLALLKTYSLDKQVPDSASTATSFLCGSKANYRTLGLSGIVKENDCHASSNTRNWVTSVLQWAQDKNKDTGFLTTTRITHATPAALYCHSPNRDLECDTKINDTFTGCVDIARQLVEQKPGMMANVILGGGRNPMGASVNGKDDENPCVRGDSRNLAQEWLSHKHDMKKSFAYITNNEQMKKLDPTKSDYIMGLFAGSHLPYEVDRSSGPQGTPSLSEMTDLALKRLKRSSNGYFLLVEGGRIDHGLHDTKPKVFLEEIVGMDAAVEVANKHADEDTLLIVMADHSHVLTLTGYPDRGNDILGKVMNEAVRDNMPYTTLMFTTGYGFGNFTWNGTDAIRPNLTNVNTTTKDYISASAVPTKEGSETHGGEDIAIYAKGPMAHLFHKVHEQSYVATVMGYAACIGPFDNDECRSGRHITGGSIALKYSSPLLFLSIIIRML